MCHEHVTFITSYPQLFYIISTAWPVLIIFYHVAIRVNETNVKETAKSSFEWATNLSKKTWPLYYEATWHLILTHCAWF